MWPFDRFTRRGRARRRLAKAVPLTADLAEGTFVRVSGSVRALDETLESALLGAPCVAFDARAKVAVLQSQHGPKFQAMPRPELTRLTPFLIEGDAGTVLVDGARALFDAPAQRVPSGDRPHAFLAMQGYSSQHGVIPRYYEIVISERDVIEVAGVLMRDAALGPAAQARAFREGPPPTMRLAGSDDHPLVIKYLSRGERVVGESGTRRWV